MYQKKLDKMDPDKMLRHVNNLNDYISVTQEVSRHPFNSSKVQFNMSTVLLLKKVRSLEIEYFNKCGGNGAAIALFERMVDQPPSKTWSLLGKELVMILQYWLDAIRKHLIKHNHHWWLFLSLLLKLIKNIRTKDRSLPDILIEGTTECLLDLATSSQPNILQRHEILCCLNICSAESSREIRFALRNKFETFFNKLGSWLCSCGYLPVQCSALEAVLRWLVPRHDRAVRADAAKKWFPEPLCGRTAVEMLLDRHWQDFFQDARDFLNACNDVTSLVTSVVCRKVTVGSIEIVSGNEKRMTWLDVNSANNSVSIVLDPRILEVIGVKEVVSWETLAVSEEEIIRVEFFRESSEATLALHTNRAPRLCPSGEEMSGSELKVALRSRTDLRRLDRALRAVFKHKYQVSLDLDKPTTLSPQEYMEKAKTLDNLEEESRFSHPVEVQRRKHSGFIVRAKHPITWQSPSTASTSSLAQLHDKLAALPQYKFDKEAVHVCALPALSTVTEISETDDRQSLLNTQTLNTNRPIGVCQKNFKVDERNSQSDGEVHKPKLGRFLSPVEQQDDSTNCLLVATIGSADESVINDTLERLTKNKDYRPDNIVNLLVQEALQKSLNDSGINSCENIKKTDVFNDMCSEVIENTIAKKSNVIHKEKEKVCTVVSNTTTDESNDVVSDTPLNFVNVRKRNIKTDRKVISETTEGQIFDESAVEEFFSQHISENKRGDIVISPTLARKLNETSSESEPFEDCLTMQDNNDVAVNFDELQDLEIVECLNSIVDRVCIDFEKFTMQLNKDTKDIEAIDVASKEADNPDMIPLADITHVENKPEAQQVKSDSKTKKAMKLKYTANKITKSTKTRAKKRNNKLELESNVAPVKESTHISNANDDNTAIQKKNAEKSHKNHSPMRESVDSDTPLIRRKRKLYSPKFENIDSEKIYSDSVKIDTDNNVGDKGFKASKIQTPKYKSTCYKDIETERKKRIRQPRFRKSKAKSDTPSPRTRRKNEMFDKLKDTIERSVTVMKADTTENDMAVYNFTSDSEDEDFKKKKIEVQKRVSSTTIGSGDSAMLLRRRRTVNRVNYSEYKSSDDMITESVTKQKKIVRRKRTPRTRATKPIVKELIDEKMREAAPEDLNTSIVVDKLKGPTSEDPKLVLAEKPEMEMIPDEEVIQVIDNTEKLKNSKKKHKKAEGLSLKRGRKVNLNMKQDNDDRTISPLPGLVIEEMPAKADDVNDSLWTNIEQKLKKIHKDGYDAVANETNTTQNLLSDVERINYSPLQMNLTDELKKFDNVNTAIEDNNNLSSKSSKSKKLNAKNTEILKIKQEKSDNIKRNLRSSVSGTPDVIKVSDTNSERTIATVGKSPITAHGDSNEKPPNTKLLTQKMTPRDLEIEYLDQSMKEYYNTLRNEINGITMENARRGSDDSEITRIIPNNEKKSPVVSIEKLSLDDITKFLPSPRDLDTNSSSVNSKKNSKDTKTSTPKFKQSKVSANQKSLPDAVEKMDQTSPSPDSMSDHDFKRSNRTKIRNAKANKNEDKCLKNSDHNNLSAISKRLRPRIDKAKLHLNFENIPSINTHVTAKTIQLNKAKEKKITTQKQVNRQSTISPIRLFDEVTSVRKEKSPILRQKSSTKADKSIIVRVESTNTNEVLSIDNQDSSIARQESANTVSSVQKKDIANENYTSDKDYICKTNTDHRPFKINDSDVYKLKRQTSPQIYYPKRRKIDFSAEVFKSGQSVDEWFRRNEVQPVSRAESISSSSRDYVMNVLEKVETSLVEMQRDTAKMVMDMYMDVQNQLAAYRNHQRILMKQTGTDLVEMFVNAINDKFTDIDNRSEEIHSAFTEQLKLRAQNTIREDCRKKQAMVTLLREDLHAVLARYGQNGSQ